MNRIDVVFKRPDNVQKKLIYVHVLEAGHNILGDVTSVWNEVFSGTFENAVLRKEGTEIQFIPNLSLKPKFDSSSSKYSLSVFGVSISDIDVINGEGRIVFDVISRVNTMNQMDPLILAVKNLPEVIKHGLKIDLVCEDISLGTTHYFSLPFLTWKNDLMAHFLDYSISFVDISSEPNADGSRKETLINLGTGADPDEFTSVENEVFVTHTFMRFSLRQQQVIPEPFDDPIILPIIKSSFKHELTDIGLRTLERLEFELLDRFRQWDITNTTFIAPMVSLCQSSGAGKSKLSLELLKRHLGFYLVFRMIRQSGYPKKNHMSDTLFKLVGSYADRARNLENDHFMNCTVGLILNFLARIITDFMNEFIKLRTENIPFWRVVERLARRFEDNSNLHEADCLVEQTLMNQIYLRFLRKPHDGSYDITVIDVAKYINNIFARPLICFIPSRPEDDLNQIAIFCREISDHLASFPFLFIVDEAELLARVEIKYEEPVDERSKLIKTGFEAFRRAMSYLEEGSKILILTLGTKSNIIDINPPVVDSSSRFSSRKMLPKPIVLSSNSNILSKEFPIHSLRPSYTMLRNPLMMKFLCTLGHGIWSSLPFDSVVNIAKTKLVNGSDDSKDYVIALWLIRTGLAANPRHAKTRNLVADHMATLLNISDDLENLIVSYPSEAILAMAARDLMGELTGDDLFRKLKQKMEAVNVDKGKVAELFAAMIVLRAIDKTRPFVLPSDTLTDHHDRLDELFSQAPEYKDIWISESHILEDEREKKMQLEEFERTKREVDVLKREINELQEQYKRLGMFSGARQKASIESRIEEIQGEILLKIPVHIERNTHFYGYTVCRVGDVLNRFVGSNINWETLGVPILSLNGIVNATHYVNLERGDQKGLKFGGLRLMPDSLPLADHRIPDISRNVIDEALLQLGMTRQCGFALPASYYGSDYMLPVCLGNGDYTFISIQVKRSGANLTDDIYKMQSRLHYVQCVDCPRFTRRCQKCVRNDRSLATMYANSISLLISLDEDGTFYNFKSDLIIDPMISKEDCDTVMKQLYAEVPDLSTVRSRVDNFFKPVIHEKITLGQGDVLLSKCMWSDSLVSANIETLPFSSASTIPFDRDPFIHRQFCIATRGWNLFRGLFTDFDSSVAIANSIIAPEGIFRNITDRENPDFIRKAIYDTAPNSLYYSDELSMARGKASSLELLEEEVTKTWDESGYPVKKAEKLTGNLEQSQSQSDLEEMASEDIAMF